MKILYAIQGTGNGHLSRALELGPQLEKTAEVDYFISGTQSDLSLHATFQYQRSGASFVFGKQGGVDIWKTLQQARPINLLKDVMKCPVSRYDIVVNDYEPITAWACKKQGVPLVSVSHQSAFISSQCPRPAYRSTLFEGLIKYYAPCEKYIGLHFESYDDHIRTPIVRKAIRELTTSDQDFITVYLPAYSGKYILEIVKSIPEIGWNIYAKDVIEPYHSGQISVYPVGHASWKSSLADCHGMIIGAGFEGPSEGLCLGKKLLVIPMKNQYEQQCNAVALEAMGVTTLPELGNSHLNAIRQWLKDGICIQKAYPDHTAELAEEILLLGGYN